MELQKGTKIMSKFNSFAIKVDEIARKAFEEYSEAHAAFQTAEAKFQSYPQGKQNADALKAKAAFFEAREKLNQAQRNMGGYNDTVAVIRRELSAALSDEYAADPAAIDGNTITLLQSGILRPDEYGKLMNEARTAGNTTMARLIAKFATDAAEKISKEYGQGDQKARELRVIANQGNIDPANSALEAFDVLADTFRRTMRNPSMIRAWDELAGPIIQAF